LALLFGVSTNVYALPGHGQVTAGSAAITHPTASTLHINQVTDKTILSWQSFSIGKNELVQFAQPSAAAVVLNRVWGGNPSIILGQLRANGQVFLINPNGILFGAGSQINVGGFVATTLPLSTRDFLTRNYQFQQDHAHGLSSVVNRGRIEITDQGYGAQFLYGTNKHPQRSTDRGKQCGIGHRQYCHFRWGIRTVWRSFYQSAHHLKRWWNNELQWQQYGPLAHHADEQRCSDPRQWRNAYTGRADRRGTAVTRFARDRWWHRSIFVTAWREHGLK